MTAKKSGAIGLTLVDALRAEPKAGHLAAAMAKRGSLEIEFYQPHGHDNQKPHSRDEIYVIARGTAVLAVESERFAARPGDVIVVPAKAKHHFMAFSADFATWVIFYGPAGGEGGD